MARGECGAVMTITRFSPGGLHCTFAIGEDAVHVWRADLDMCRVKRPSLCARLAADERARAVSFRVGEGRRRFVTV